MDQHVYQRPEQEHDERPKRAVDPFVRFRLRTLTRHKLVQEVTTAFVHSSHRLSRDDSGSVKHGSLEVESGGKVDE